MASLAVKRLGRATLLKVEREALVGWRPEGAVPSIGFERSGNSFGLRTISAEHDVGHGVSDGPCTAASVMNEAEDISGRHGGRNGRPLLKVLAERPGSSGLVNRRQNSTA